MEENKNLEKICPVSITEIDHYPEKEDINPNIELGTLYDVNKNIMAQMPKLSKNKIKEKINEIFLDYFYHRSNQYYMLLCNDRKDYTLFNFITRDLEDEEIFKQDFYECLENRGDVLSIEKQKDSAYEIWIKINEDIYCYYLFEYDMGVLEYGK